MREVTVYNAEPTASRFHTSDAFVRGIRGPVGSGKSVACCMEILSRACRQIPNSKGERKSRWAIIRNTYAELLSTTIKTWCDWIPKDVCPIVYSKPARGNLRLKQPDGTVVDLELLFLALNRDDDVKKLLSLELTGGWINEAREVPKAILDALTGRVRRYPSKKDGGYNWSGIIMDTNPPDSDHWWYRLAEEETPLDWEFFYQPPAVIYNKTLGEYIPNPEAENIRHLTEGTKYYTGQLGGKTREWIKVMLMGEYGTVENGRVVYPEYNDDIHCANEELQAYKNIPLIVSFDFGLTPACAIIQLSPRGHLRIIDELCSENMGITQFMRDVVMPYLTEKYSTFLTENSIYVTGDPSGTQRAQTNETTCFDVLRAFGFDDAAPATTNAFIPRREAVALYMTRLSDGQPAFILSPRCKILRKGFLGGYRLRRVQVAGDSRYIDEPEKNQFSHIQEALQYGALKTADTLFWGKKAANTIKDDEIPCAWAM